MSNLEVCKAYTEMAHTLNDIYSDTMEKLIMACMVTQNYHVASIVEECINKVRAVQKEYEEKYGEENALS